MMHYHQDNQYANTKRTEGYAKSITDQNIFVTNESAKSIRYFQEDLNPWPVHFPRQKQEFQENKFA
jgi:hypothetical protein